MHSPKPSPAIFARAPGDAQELARQVAAGRARLAGLGYEPASAIVFATVDQLVRAAERSEVRCVAVADLSRFSRDPDECMLVLARLAAAGATVVTIDETIVEGARL